MTLDTQNTLPENTDFSYSFQQGFYLLSTASHPMAITADYKYICHLHPVNNTYEPTADSIQKANIDAKNIDMEIIDWQLAGYLPILKWTNSEPNFIPRAFQKKLSSGNDIQWFLATIETIQTQVEYKQAIDHIMEQG